MRFTSALLLTLCLASPALAGAGQPRDEQERGGQVQQPGQRMGQVTPIDRVRGHLIGARGAFVMGDYEEARRELSEARRYLDQAVRANPELQDSIQDLRGEFNDVQDSIRKRDARAEKNLEQLENRIERYSPRR